jgi:hypothetical protein
VREFNTFGLGFDKKFNMTSTAQIIAEDNHNSDESNEDQPMKRPKLVVELNPSPPTTKSVRAKTPPARKTAELQSWNNIFAQCKLIISLSPRDSKPEIMVHHTQAEFRNNFGYDQSTLPFPLKTLFGKATIRYSTVKLQNALMGNKSTCEYMNLYKQNGTPLSCHVTLTTLTGRSVDIDPLTTVMSTEKWGVVTIRSASVVGNSKFSGIGLLGVEGLPDGALQADTSRRPRDTDK